MVSLWNWEQLWGFNPVPSVVQRRVKDWFSCCRKLSFGLRLERDLYKGSVRNQRVRGSETEPELGNNCKGLSIRFLPNTHDHISRESTTSKVHPGHHLSRGVSLYTRCDYRCQGQEGRGCGVLTQLVHTTGFIKSGIQIEVCETTSEPGNENLKEGSLLCLVRSY